MRALDLYCGAGCSSIGLHWAGFDEVVGIDINPQPNYPFEFIQSDIESLPVDIRTFDFVWASPPCQLFSSMTPETHRNKHQDYIPLTREILKGHPYTAIENVPQAPIRPDIILTGSSVGLDYIVRARHFELSFFMLYPPPKYRLEKWKWDLGIAMSITTTMAAKTHFYRRKKIGLPGRPSNTEIKNAMGIPQHYNFTKKEMGEGVPPAYSELIASEAIKRMEGYCSDTFSQQAI